MTSQDSRIDKLLEVVAAQKAEIAKDEVVIQGKWRTNCMYPLHGKPVHLHAVKKETELAEVLADVIVRAEAFSKASSILGLAEKVEQRIFGYTYSEWEIDIKKQLASLQIRSKNAKLATMEESLKALMSPERKAVQALEAIEKELLG